MPERPFLPFPKAVVEKRQKLGGGGGNVTPPSPAAQKARLDKRFQDIISSFDNLQTNVEGIIPEQVIVLETLGQSENELAKAAAKIPGLEWLAEIDLGAMDPSDGFQDAKDGTKPLSARLYAMMSNKKAMADLLSLWNQWLTDPTKRATTGFGPFKNIFIYLKDVRRWGPQDRLAETGVVEAWQQFLKYAKQPVRFEVELWCRRDAAARASAFARLEQLIAAEKGRCIAQTAVPDILYHGVLAELPPDAVERTIEKIQKAEYTDLLRAEDVMFFRPQGQAVLPISREEAVALDAGAAAAVRPQRAEPVIALLDGHPLPRHERLEGWLRIDDPDGLAGRYQPSEQEHGTAMASLIVHGDLNETGETLDRPVYLRPVLVPEKDFSGNVQERTPDDVLLVDLFHRAILRMKGQGQDAGAAPSVRIVNLSFGNSFQPFDRNLSPLAKLLDWLVWKYNILFLVSAGNQPGSITLEASSAAWQQLSDDALRKQTLQALWKTQVTRRPFSPAESINSLTVGAWHQDASTPPSPDRRVDLWKGASLPSPLATVALGFGQAAKPEVFFPGGRQYFMPPAVANQDPARFQASVSTRPPGILVAAPGKTPMELNRTAHSCGTSNATALATRTAALAYRQLEQVQGTTGWERLAEPFFPVLIKAMLVHGASWGNAVSLIDEVFKPANGSDWQILERARMRFLGYGAVDRRKALMASDERATLLAWDEIAAEDGHVYRFPLPPSLAAKRVLRRLTITLAWFSPINPFHSNYRGAQLWFTVPDGSKALLKVDKAGLDAKSAQRGTVQHQVFAGESATVFRDGDGLVIRLNCTADAGKLSEPVRYGLVASLEVGPGMAVPVFEEVAERVRPRIPIQPTP